MMVEVCKVSDLLPGREFRTPEGDTLMVVAKPSDAQFATDLEDNTLVVSLRVGVLTTVPADTRLGYDHNGRLYASMGDI